MASIGHIAVGIAAARVHGRCVPAPGTAAAWAALSLLPDVDVVGFAFGVDYAAPWGHRGATHSLLMSLLGSIAIGVSARRASGSVRRTTLLALAVLTSHAVLDTMTDGGLGCALLWPFTNARYFAPWRPIPVAPIGSDFISRDGAFVALTELALFWPIMVFALVRRRTTATAVAVALIPWLAGVAVIGNGHSRTAISGYLLGDETHYTVGFSETAFGRIALGQSERDVSGRIGPPHTELWFFGPPDRRAPDERPAAADECLVVSVADGRVTHAFATEPCRSRGVHEGQTTTEVRRQLGPPTESCWQYSWSATGKRHRLRVVCFSDGTVQRVVSKWN
jgi:inner membrane protein